MQAARCIELIHELSQLADTFPTHWTTCRRLCKRCEMFLEPLLALQHNHRLALTDSSRGFILHNLEALLLNIKKFSQEFSDGGFLDMFTRVKKRTLSDLVLDDQAASEAPIIGSLNKRFIECIMKFNVIVDYEQKLREDLEDLHNYLKLFVDFKIQEISHFDTLNMLPAIETLKETIVQYAASIPQFIHNMGHRSLVSHDTKGIDITIKELLRIIENKRTEYLLKLQNIERIMEDGQIEAKIVLKLYNQVNLSKEETMHKERLIRKYCFEDKEIKQSQVILGKGQYGSVYLGKLCKYPLKATVAIKSITLPTDRPTHEALGNEMLLLRYISNPHCILQCYGCVFDPLHINEGKLLLEYAPYGTVESILTNLQDIPILPIQLQFAWLYDIMNALSFLHEKSIHHNQLHVRQLFLFDSLRVKLGNIDYPTSSTLNIFATRQISVEQALVIHDPFGSTTYATSTQQQVVLQHDPDLAAFLLIVLHVFHRGRIHPRQQLPIEAIAQLIDLLMQDLEKLFAATLLDCTVTADAVQLLNAFHRMLLTCIGLDGVSASPYNAKVIADILQSMILLFGEDIRFVSPPTDIITRIENKLKHVHRENILEQQNELSNNIVATYLDSSASLELTSQQRQELIRSHPSLQTRPLEQLSSGECMYLFKALGYQNIHSFVGRQNISGNCLVRVESKQDLIDIGLEVSQMSLDHIYNALITYKFTGVPIEFLSSVMVQDLQGRRKNIDVMPLLTTADDIFHFLETLEQYSDETVLQGLQEIVEKQYNNKELNVKLSELDVIPLILKAIEIPSIPVLELLLRITKYLCRYDGESDETIVHHNVNSIGKQRGCEIMMQLIVDHMDKEVVVKVGCEIIGFLAKGSKQYHEMISVELNCVDVLLKIIQNYMSKAMVIKAALGSFCRVTLPIPHNKHQIDVLINIFLEIIERYPMKQVIVESAFHAMQHLSVQVESLLIPPDKITMMYNAFANHLISATTVLATCKMVVSLTNPSRNRANSPFFGSAEWCKSLCKVLEHYKSSPEIIKATLHCFNNFSIISENLTTLRNEKGCEMVLRTLKRYYRKKETVKYCCSAIIAMVASCDENKEKFGQKGCCEMCLTLLKQFIADEDIVQLLCRIMVQLSTLSANIERFAKLESCTISILTLINAHMKQSAPMKCACAVVAIFAENPTLQVALSTDGANQLLQEALLWYANDLVMKAEVSVAILNLCHKNEVNKDYFGSDEAICNSLLSSLLRQHNTDNDSKAGDEEQPARYTQMSTFLQTLATFASSATILPSVKQTFLACDAASIISVVLREEFPIIPSTDNRSKIIANRSFMVQKDEFFYCALKLVSLLTDDDAFLPILLQQHVPEVIFHQYQHYYHRYTQSIPLLPPSSDASFTWVWKIIMYSIQIFTITLQQPPTASSILTNEIAANSIECLKHCFVILRKILSSWEEAVVVDTMRVHDTWRLLGEVSRFIKTMLSHHVLQSFARTVIFEVDGIKSLLAYAVVIQGQLFDESAISSSFRKELLLSELDNALQSILYFLSTTQEEDDDDEIKVNIFVKHVTHFVECKGCEFLLPLLRNCLTFPQEQIDRAEIIPLLRLVGKILQCIVACPQHMLLVSEEEWFRLYLSVLQQFMSEETVVVIYLQLLQTIIAQESSSVIHDSLRQEGILNILTNIHKQYQQTLQAPPARDRKMQSTCESVCGLCNNLYKALQPPFGLFSWFYFLEDTIIHD